ncbi:MAG: methyltransferase domain-containing protein [Candidatus Dadabacteria bacterium]|nr:MAG: methyltransferase domain-containing protein [Candidatus Dadabacteria bacterium]
MKTPFKMARTMRGAYTEPEAWFYDRVIEPAIEAFHLALLDRLIADVAPDAAVCDVGCGGGQLLLAIAARRPDLKLTGIDLNPGQIRRARGRARRAGVDIDFRIGSADDLPLDDASQHEVISVASIKHWPDPTAGLRDCLRVLRPGGRLRVIEVDRGCHLADARAFVSGFRVPAPLREVATALFRTYVAGQSYDLLEMRELARQIADQGDCTVERLAGTPAWMLEGRRNA